MKERLAKSGLEVDTGTPARLQSLLASEIVRWGKAITEAGIKVQ
jgi:tripartite-type tricarboxylate transporter receptor subunit TctC